MKPSDIVLINSILSEDTAKNLAEYVTKYCVQDLEPFSKLPYRGSITYDDIKLIDDRFIPNLYKIIEEFLTFEISNGCFGSQNGRFGGGTTVRRNVTAAAAVM